jgi:hypothetical protein
MIGWVDALEEASIIGVLDYVDSTLALLRGIGRHRSSLGRLYMMDSACLTTLPKNIADMLGR